MLIYLSLKKCNSQREVLEKIGSSQDLQAEVEIWFNRRLWISSSTSKILKNIFKIYIPFLWYFLP